MRRLSLALACTVVVALPLRTQAASLSGILVYAADQHGDPSGWDAEAQKTGNYRVWHTQRDGKWPGLGLLIGPLPESVQGPLLNGFDFSVDVTLSLGTNDFTLIGEALSPSKREGAGNQFDYFVLNLYFDGQLDEPGISVLFPRRGSTEGEIPNANQSDRVFTLAVEDSVRGVPAMAFDDGSVRVSIDAVSFGPAQWPLLVNKVSASAPSPGGGNDWVGTLSLFVEPSTAPGSGGGRDTGLPTGEPPVGSVRIGPDAVGAVPGVLPREGEMQAPSPAAPLPHWQAAADSLDSESTPPAALPLGSATPNITPTPAATAQPPTLSAKATSIALTPTVKPSARASVTTAETATPAVPATPEAARATP